MVLTAFQQKEFAVPPIRSSPKTAAAPPPPPNGGLWQQRTVRVAVENGDDGRKDVLAQCYGGVAVHPSTDRRKAGAWTVTAVACGMALCSVGTEADARQIAEWSWDHQTLALREADSEAANARLPEWFREWIRACRKAGCWTDPTSFRQPAKGGK